MPRRGEPPVIAPTGSIPLVFGGAQYGGLVVAGLFATIPTLTWAGMLMVWFNPDLSNRPGLLDDLGVAVATTAGLALVLLGPSVVPCLILRARQPDGARVTWDEAGVSEWDGLWQRALVPWVGARAAGFAWQIHTKGTSFPQEALQLRALESDNVITLWTTEPESAPVIRRRLCSEGAAELRAAVEAHGIALTGDFNPALAAEAGRFRPVWALRLGRWGYIAAVVGPLIAGPSPQGGLVVGVIGATLLGIRALPVLAELRALLARNLTGSKGDDGARRAAERQKLRAVIAEAALRVAFPVLTLVTTWISAFVLPF